MSTVSVMLGERSYPIRIAPGALGTLGEALGGEASFRRAVVISTRRVADLHGERVLRSLGEAGIRAELIAAGEGERSKSWRGAARIFDRLLELGTDRDTAIVALGGGALCDLAGFVASTYLRGLPLVQVPTTLLAQVDSSVGGKTALHHRGAANLLGTFCIPHLVQVDPEVVGTLHTPELRAGLVEIVKVAAIWDGEFFDWLETHLEAATHRDLEARAEMITRACSIKAEVVGLDDRQAGLRALLHLGRPPVGAPRPLPVASAAERRPGTVATAPPPRIEDVASELAWGMVLSAEVSERLELAPAGCAARLQALLSRTGALRDESGWRERAEAHLNAWAADKEAGSPKRVFVALREIGRAEVVELGPDELCPTS